MRKSILLVLTFAALSGCMPDRQKIFDSFAFVDAEMRGSGFYAGSGVVITACHVIEGFEGEFVVVKNMHGSTTIARQWECSSNRDIAYLYISNNIFADHIAIGGARRGPKYGCFSGRWKEDGRVKTRCRMGWGKRQDMVFLGTNAIYGMSGGPCYVLREHDTVAVGVLYLSNQPGWNDGDKDTLLGVAACQLFDGESLEILDDAKVSWRERNHDGE